MLRLAQLRVINNTSLGELKFYYQSQALKNINESCNGVRLSQNTGHRSFFSPSHVTRFCLQRKVLHLPVPSILNNTRLWLALKAHKPSVETHTPAHTSICSHKQDVPCTSTPEVCAHMLILSTGHTHKDTHTQLMPFGSSGLEMQRSN